MWHSTPIPWVVHCCLTWLVLLVTLATAERLPGDVISRSRSLIEGIEKSSSVLQKRDNGTFLLRIMPLGASITLGYGSTDHNGYRKPLRQQLRYAGWQVNMIGSLRNGTMHDNEHDGHFGYRIDQLEDKTQKTILEKPNLILIK
ncbi:hypothetical protein PENSUB_8590 [Penicillium subrubescens]|uniref:Uncharacterized protein n=1 Tax=Penicillium subrubescens TaxID=1316194 RepID=A0A1Q5TG41_9EURO|nr:hypothetical protein PENSUB_8590 [Penicillium subrubescens]